MHRNCGTSMGRRTLWCLFSLTAAVAALVWLSGCGGGEESEPTTITASRPESAGTAADSESAAPETAAAAATEQTGDLTGVITYSGPVPELPFLVKQGEQVKNADVCAAHNIPDESLMVNEEAGNALANVFVYLATAPKGAEAGVPEEPVVLDQKGCMFTPHALVVQAGQTVLVKSDDPIAHNVHTKPLRNQEFNQTIQQQDRDGLPLVYRYAEPAPVSVKCDIHPWMSAYHLVVDHPFAAVTDAEGRFTIKGLPAGKHKFRIWHERANWLDTEYEVEIKPGETTEISLSYAAEKFQ